MAVDNIFRWIWRINGLILLIGAIAIGVVMLMGMFSGLGRNAPGPVVSNIATDPEGSEKWVLGRSRSVSGSMIIYIPLESENKNLDIKHRESEMNFYSGGGYRRTFAKNVLFIDTKTDEMNWLFEDVDQLIVSIDQLPKNYDESKTTKYITYAVITKDTNGDGKINENDNAALAYSNLDGSGYQVILDDHERLISEILHEDDVLSVVYQKSGAGFVSRYSLNPFKLITNAELPKIE